MAKRKGKPYKSRQSNRSQRNERPADRDDAPRKDERSNQNDTSRQYDRTNGMNDISWYIRYPDLAQAAGQFPYPYRPGMTLPATTDASTLPGTPIPGVFAINWMPSFGFSTSPTDPASVAAKEIYARVRSVYSGSLDADAPDYIMYLGALDSIFSYIGHLKRVYRLLTAYSPNNRVIPETVLISLGFTSAQITTLQLNRERFWQEINSLVYMSRKFTCPSLMDIFNRHYWMNDNVYTDANTINSQFYVFSQKYVLEYVPGQTPDGVEAAGLQYQPCDPTSITNTYKVDVDVALYQYGRDLIDALVAWDDSYTISGYLQRAFPDVPGFIVELLPQEEMLVPVYNEEVLTQIENCRTINKGGVRFNLSELRYTQDPKTNSVLFSNVWPVTTTSTDYLHDITDPLVSIRSDTPTVADNIIATRLTSDSTIQFVSGSTTQLEAVIVAGSEIVINFTLQVGPNTKYDGVTSTAVISNDSTVQNAMAVIRNLGVFMQFDWHPYSTAIFVSGQAVTGVSRLVDLHNATIISKDALQNLHNVCLYSELNAFRF